MNKGIQARNQTAGRRNRLRNSQLSKTIVSFFPSVIAGRVLFQGGLGEFFLFPNIPMCMLSFFHHTEKLCEFQATMCS